MLYFPLDTAGECDIVYTEDDTFEKYDLNKHTETLDYYHWLDKDKTTYLRIYFENEETFTSLCPSDLVNVWKKIKQTMSFHLESLLSTKVDINNGCIYDYLPLHFLRDYYSVKIAILQSIKQQLKERIESYSDNYCKELKNLLFLCKKIEDNELKLDYSLCEDEQRTRLLSRNLNKYIRYDIRSKTGRLSLKNHSFPISNLNTEDRVIIIPKMMFLLN
jgi:hypothetical protein